MILWIMEEIMKHGYFIHQSNSTLGPFMSNTIALRMAQLVKGYWSCILITSNGDKISMTTIGSGFNNFTKEH